jgi:catechol-2,3-dioxygenase
MAFPFTVHIALTVQDLDRSVAWYSRLFDAPPVVQDRHDGYRFAAWLEPAVGLHQFEQPNGTRFDEHVSGLDHLAFNCETRAELEALERRLSEIGVEHGAICDVWYGSALSFRDPDGIAVEFFAGS